MLSEICEDVSSGKTFDLEQSNITDLYGYYDTLLTDFPLYVSKNLLGYGTASDGTDDTTLPIYEYIIKPPTNGNIDGLQNPIDLYPYPVILINCGIHGGEKTPPWGTYNFIKQMLEKKIREKGLSNLNYFLKLFLHSLMV